jgi:uncharacterized membrane protein
MPGSVQAGLLLALGTAFVSMLGFLLKQRGAVQTPPISVRTPVRSTAALFANRWWLLGLAVATASWFLHVGALALAPITLVQTVIAGGLVLLTVMAERVFGFHVTRREWIGVALTAAGLAFLAATLGHSADGRHSDYAAGTLALYVGGLTAVSLVLMATVPRSRAHAGTVLATAAGLQWGCSDVTIKALSGHLGADGLLVLFTPMAAAITGLSLLGLLVSARSLQIGEAISVIATTSAAANLSTIAAGLVVFGEPLPGGTPAIAARLVAFSLVVGAAVLTPGPARLGAPAAVTS